MTTRKKLPKGWRWAKLDAVLEIDNQGIRPAAGTVYRYIGLENIEGGLGDFIEIPEVDGQQIGSGKYIFGEGHILYGKLRPYLNKVALPEFEGICSTDILPLLPKTDVSKEYLAFWLRAREFVDYATQYATGTKMPRLGPDKLLAASIPLPPTLPEQERIVEVLRQADAIRRKRAEARRLADQILPALFLDMFGDPNTSGFSATLDSCATIRRGISKRPDSQGNTPIIRIKNLTLDGLVYESPVLVLADEDDIGRGRLTDGDIVMSPLNGSLDHVGKSDMFVAPDDRPWLLDSNLCAIRAKSQKSVPLWLETWLRLTSTRERLRRMAVKTSGGQWLINSSVLARMEVPLPGYSAQEEFLDRHDLARTVFDKSSDMGDDTERLFSVLLSRAFTGELTA